jgi:hypothetical protein
MRYAEVVRCVPSFRRCLRLLGYRCRARARAEEEVEVSASVAPADRSKHVVRSLEGVLID